jgi:hypothetical protein
MDSNHHQNDLIELFHCVTAQRLFWVPHWEVASQIALFAVLDPQVTPTNIKKTTRLLARASIDTMANNDPRCAANLRLRGPAPNDGAGYCSNKSPASALVNATRRHSLPPGAPAHVLGPTMGEGGCANIGQAGATDLRSVWCIPQQAAASQRC